ncbi:hypothetical protein [Pseudanabaena sp. FACHB-2040]|uniref:hypothetical protein n=1 Tax=Pseudanabaena sp. FACHB-2040 TaxID=2692859 RepID=UPI0016878F9D|nr:hypothetical protein [Pseudanabaena sp. FACHB-2040]MBD2259928.1 hypothetical protein [Pseudanabaena sp. FACHB-2040]
MTNSPSSVNLPRFVPPEKASASTESSAKQRECSFEIGSKSLDAASPRVVPRSVQTPLLPRTSHLPMLPRKKRPLISSHRHDANPALATKVLEDIQGAVEGWHQALRQTLLDIQAIYLEGPIVEGWLEMVSPPGAGQGVNSSILRHADPQELTGYVDRLCQAAATARSGTAQSPTAPHPDPQYRLCSLDADGQLQCQICPPDQIPFVSVAIARHQKLRQHLNQKQYLEARLKRAVEVLTQAREDLDISPNSGPTNPQ